MKGWTLFAVATALIAAAWWNWPAVAQRASPPATGGEMITFDQYREFRIRDLQQREARLTRQLAAPDLSPAQKASLEHRKAYYDQLAEMPAEERDLLFRERFDQIDSNHNGELDPDERAAWREKQREHYRQQAAERAASTSRQR